MGKLVIPSIVANNGGGGGGGGSATWGDISGTLSNQTDLQNALDSKVNINNQNIKSYHAPSATLDTTLAIVIPNVDAVQEDGLYNVDYVVENEGTVLNANCILSVGTVNVSDTVVQVDQTMVIGLNGSYVYLNRNYIGGQWSAWSGKNIPVELLKCLQNKATGTNALTILGNATNKTNSINIGNSTSASAANSTIIGASASSGTSGGATSIGASSQAEGGQSVAVGYLARATSQESIQLGTGTNSVYKQFQVYTYPMLDGNTGKIPNERLRITVANTSSTSATIANIEGGKDYTFSQALTALTITAITSSFIEANIYFTADTGIAVTLPQGTNTIGDFTFTAGKSYVISILNGIAVRGELN